MSFSNFTTFSKPRTKRPVVSDKWTRLGPPKEKGKGLRRVGKKGEFWLFVGLIVNKFFEKIGLPDTCEIQNEVCDNYHRAWAHSRRRQDIRVGDFWYALRVVRACQECHYFVDSQGRRAAEPIIEGIIVDRFTRLGLSDEKVRSLLLECSLEVQIADEKFAQYVVII